MLAVILSIGVALVSVVGLSRVGRGPEVGAQPSLESKVLTRQITDLSKKISTLETSVLKITKGDTQPIERPDLQRITLELAAIQERLLRLDEAITDTPEEAVSTVLLRRDVEEIRKASDATARAIGRDIDRVYDMTKWLFGLFLTMALSILSLALTALAKTAPKEPAKGES